MTEFSAPSGSVVLSRQNQHTPMLGVAPVNTATATPGPFPVGVHRASQPSKRPMYATPTTAGLSFRGAQPALSGENNTDSVVLLSSATKADLYENTLKKYHAGFSNMVTTLYVCMVVLLLSNTVFASLSAVAAAYTVTATGEGPGFLAGLFAGVPMLILIQGSGYSPWYLYNRQRGLNLGMLIISFVVVAIYAGFETWFLFGWCATGSTPRTESIIIDQTCTNQIGVIWVAMLGAWWLTAWILIATVTAGVLLSKVSEYTEEYERIVKSEEDARLFAEQAKKLNAGKFGPADPGMVLESFQVLVRFSEPKKFA